MRPISIKRTAPESLLIIWDDDHQTIFALDHFRRICPCATCAGEDLLLHHYPAQPPPMSVESKQLVALESVGNYAIQAVWNDGHNAGIYTWEYLREHCLCAQCSPTKQNQAF